MRSRKRTFLGLLYSLLGCCISSGTADDGGILGVKAGIEDVEVVHIEDNLHLVTKMRLCTRVNAGDKVVGAIDQVKEDLITHQFGDIDGNIDRFGDDTRRSEYGVVNVFRTNTEDDVFADNGFVLFMILGRNLDAEGVHVNKHFAIFNINLTIEEVHGW